jgi:hypothetical protein
MGYDSHIVGRNLRATTDRCIIGVIDFKDFEIILCGDDKVMTIGHKRNILYREASALYSWQIDDDDDIHDNAIPLILAEMEAKPDCITFQEYCRMNGTEYKSNHSIAYPDWDGDGSKMLHDGFHFHRTPFYKDVIKTKIAKEVHVPNIRYGEDHEWARMLKPILKTEAHIDEEIYRYIHDSKPEEFNSRYGLDKQ